MLFLRAIPFSFAILWRFAIVLPVMLLVMVVFGIQAAILTVFFGFIAPLFAVLMITAFSIASSVIPTLVGMRVGLQAKGVKPRSSFIKLIFPALGYGLFEALSVLILLVFALGIYLLASPLTVDDLLNYQSGGQEVFVANLLAESQTITYAMLIVGGLLLVSLRTALLVPFAGASVGADPDGRPHTPFMGFGGGFFSNFALVILSFVGNLLVPAAVMWIMITLGMAGDFAQALGALMVASSFDQVTVLIPDLALPFAIGLILYLFFFSLPCAGAVIYYADEQAAIEDSRRAFDAAVTNQEQARTQEQPERPAPNQELLELMRSRMPKTRE